ncbi:MAG: divalent-cation tolerance protein CutA [Patescibacteria group bacterium]
MVLIYTTCRDTGEAVRIGQMILERKIAVCVNLWPIQSLWIAEDGIKSERESALLIKTNENKVQEVEDLILKNHTYATPFIGAVNVDRLNREYKEWMQKVMQMA